jgi:CBS domain-containing protein
MYRNNIRRLVIVDRETMVGIITDKDIFRALMNNQTLLASLGSIEPIAEQRTAYDQFTKYWFSDIYHKQ